MKNEDKLNDLLNSFNGQWDTDEPAMGHQKRFLDKLELKNKKKKKKDTKIYPYKIALSIAAAIIVMLGVFITYKPVVAPQNRLAKVSPQVRETQLYFSSIIEKEVAKLEEEDSPETQKIVRDAFEQMKKLEKDYDRLINELVTKGENKQLIHAMITNLQTRISFLEDVLIQVENTKNLKEKFNDNKTI
jgi:DNA-directed RNA polymerase beta' subunit